MKQHIKNFFSVSDNKERWISILKAFAIIAVLYDHNGCVMGITITNRYFHLFSVSIFVILMGITQYWHYERIRRIENSNSIKKALLVKIIAIYTSYFVAVFVYEVIEYGLRFNLSVFLKKLLYFEAATPHYYILLYIQLLILCPLFFYLIERIRISKYRIIKYIIIFIVLLPICSWTTQHTMLFDVYGGGGRLFGGTYLILLYIGMLIGLYIRKARMSIKENIIAFVSFGVLTTLWMLFMENNKFQIDRLLPFGGGKNPPSISVFVYSILVFGFLYAGCGLFEKVGIIKKIGTLLVWLGEHTLYIFLYHWLFLEYSEMYIPNILNEMNDSLIKVYYSIMIIVGPLLIEFLFRYIANRIKEIYVSEWTKE